MKLFIDMDGVLADFDQHYEDVFGTRPSREFDNADWDKVRAVGDFYLNIPPMADMAELWEFAAPFNPTILTGIPKSVDEAADNKRAWVRKNLGAHVPVICCRSSEKYLHGGPDAVLVDDWEKYKDKWVRAGGVWITHVTARQSVETLKRFCAT